MTCSLTPVTRNKSSLDLILCAFWIRSLLGDYMHCEHNNHTKVSNINSSKKYQQHTVIYWEQYLMCKLTGGPGFPLIPGGPGKPRAPWKKKAIKCTRKLLCLLEAINCYILTPEAGFKRILQVENYLLTFNFHQKSSHRMCYFGDFWCTSQTGKKILIYLSLMMWRSMPDCVLLLTTVGPGELQMNLKGQGKNTFYNSSLERLRPHHNPCLMHLYTHSCRSSACDLSLALSHFPYLTFN